MEVHNLIWTNSFINLSDSQKFYKGEEPSISMIYDLEINKLKAKVEQIENLLEEIVEIIKLHDKRMEEVEKLVAESQDK